jgi:hypothetical protein
MLRLRFYDFDGLCDFTSPTISKQNTTIWMLKVLDSVIVVAFQITFCAEIHANDIFFIFLKLFLISAHQNDLKRTNHIKF